MQQDMRLLPIEERGSSLTIIVDGEEINAFAGETIASALLAAGKHIFRYSDNTKAPRGVFCGQGICFDCLVTVDGTQRVRACVTTVRDGMVIETGEARDD